MDTGTTWVIISLGVVISVLLAKYSLKKLSIIKKAKAALQAQETEQNERRKETINSIKIIAQCIVEGQVELSEGCIRIKVLLDHVDPSLHKDPTFSIFSTMYEATEHMPTHGARKQADKKLIHKLDQERFGLEAKYKEEIMSASESIRSYEF